MSPSRDHPPAAGRGRAAPPRALALVVTLALATCAPLRSHPLVSADAGVDGPGAVPAGEAGGFADAATTGPPADTAPDAPAADRSPPLPAPDAPADTAPRPGV